MAGLMKRREGGGWIAFWGGEVAEMVRAGAGKADFLTPVD